MKRSTMKRSTMKRSTMKQQGGISTRVHTDYSYAQIDRHNIYLTLFLNIRKIFEIINKAADKKNPGDEINYRDLINQDKDVETELNRETIFPKIESITEEIYEKNKFFSSDEYQAIKYKLKIKPLELDDIDKIKKKRDPDFTINLYSFIQSFISKTEESFTLVIQPYETDKPFMLFDSLDTPQEKKVIDYMNIGNMDIFKKGKENKIKGRMNNKVVFDKEKITEVSSQVEEESQHTVFKEDEPLGFEEDEPTGFEEGGRKRTRRKKHRKLTRKRRQ
jgi:hypothetical protein